MDRSYLWYLSKDYVCLLNAPNTQVRLELLQGNKVYSYRYLILLGVLYEL